VLDELKNGPAKEYDLGKFLFSVGTGTLGFLLVATKVSRNTDFWNYPLALSFITLIFAMGISIVMVIPKNWKIEENTDLFDAKAAVVGRTVFDAKLWFVFWPVGLISGIFGVLR
jgi:hypothetical protein